MPVHRPKITQVVPSQLPDAQIINNLAQWILDAAEDPTLREALLLAAKAWVRAGSVPATNVETLKVRLSDVVTRHSGIRRSTDPEEQGPSFQGALTGQKTETSQCYACIQCPLCQRWCSWTRHITDIDQYLNAGYIVRMANRATAIALGAIDHLKVGYGHLPTCRLWRDPSVGGYGEPADRFDPISELVGDA
jgi:hypothetical protein